MTIFAALLCRAALLPFTPQSLLMSEIAPKQCQDLALGFAEVPEFHVGPFLKSIKIPVDLNPLIQWSYCSPQPRVIAESLKSPRLEETSKIITLTKYPCGHKTSP